MASQSAPRCDCPLLVHRQQVYPAELIVGLWRHFSSVIISRERNKRYKP
jgi:hypothetical protein